MRQRDTRRTLILPSRKILCASAGRSGSLGPGRWTAPSWSGATYHPFLVCCLPCSRSFPCKSQLCAWPSLEELFREVFAIPASCQGRSKFRPGIGKDVWNKSQNIARFARIPEVACSSKLLFGRSQILGEEFSQRRSTKPSPHGGSGTQSYAFYVGEDGLSFRSSGRARFLHRRCGSC